MHVDEYRDGFAHRTRSNRPRGYQDAEQAGGDPMATPGPAGPTQRHPDIRELTVGDLLRVVEAHGQVVTGTVTHIDRYDMDGFLITFDPQEDQ